MKQANLLLDQQIHFINKTSMKINATIKPSSLTEEDAVNIKDTMFVKSD